MKIARLPLQIIALLLHIYFIVETIRLHVYGYVLYMGEPIGTSWFSLLFTLLIVVGCEILSFIDAILFVRTKKNKYSKLYLALVIINAICFMTMAYYTLVGTVICFVLYGVLFILRLANLATNTVDIFKRA